MHGLKLRWAAFSLSYYAANAVWQGYMSLYYRNLGFGEGKIGMINAAIALAALLVQPLWGTLCDRSSQPRRLLFMAALFSAAVLPLALCGESFIWQLGFACAFYAFYCALLPMGDAILLDGLNRRGLAFGPYRLAGALSFAAAGAAFGWLLDHSDARFVVHFGAGLLLPAAFFALLLPEKTRKERRKKDFAALLHDRALMRLLAFLLPVQMTMGYFYTFFAPYFASLPGGNPSLLGLSHAVATMGEIPYLIFCDKIYDRFGAAKPMCVSALVLMLRWLLLGFSPNAAVALAGQLLHGGGFIVMTVSMAQYISRRGDENLRTSGQMLLSMASGGVARVAGNLGGGFLAEKIGAANVFFVGAGVCFAALCIFAPKILKSRS